MIVRIVAPALLLALGAAGQGWEAGGVAGLGYTPGRTASSPAGAAEAGLARAAAFGVYLSQDVSERLGGELRYLFRSGDLKANRNGTSAAFGGETHLVHYDLLIYASGRRAKARLYFGAGGGVRVTRGTGREAAYQPLMECVLLTRGRQAQPAASLTAGVKFPVSKAIVRLELRQYLSPFPTKVIAPAAGAKIDGWLHDIVPLVSVGWRL